MKRKLPLLLAVLMLLSIVYTPIAYAAPSRERDETTDNDYDAVVDNEYDYDDGSIDDDTIDIDDDDVPLIDLPTAVIDPKVTVDEDGNVSAEVDADQIRDAIEAVVDGSAVQAEVIADASDLVDDAADGSSFGVKLPKDALKDFVEQTDADMTVSIIGVGQMVLPHDALAALVEAANGDYIILIMIPRTADVGKEALLGTGMDVAEDLIQKGSTTEVYIISNGEYITRWGGKAITLRLPVGSGLFEVNKGYRVIQISADGSVTEHTGRCGMGVSGLYVQIEITHLSTFVVLPGAVVEDMGPAQIPMTASPLAYALESGSSNGGSSSMTYMWFAAAGLVLVGTVGGVMLKRRQDSETK